jgi:hypothetical protein
MSLREERMAKNEAASREINEKIQVAYQGEPAANRIGIVCECARMTCDAAIDIALDEYEDAREDARHFVIFPGGTSSVTSSGSSTRTTVSPW